MTKRKAREQNNAAAYATTSKRVAEASQVMASQHLLQNQVRASSVGIWQDRLTTKISSLEKLKKRILEDKRLDALAVSTQNRLHTQLANAIH
jgi:uncharacterized protein YaeQ